jgi:hypothetical protein
MAGRPCSRRGSREGQDRSPVDVRPQCVREARTRIVIMDDGERVPQSNLLMCLMNSSTLSLSPRIALTPV